MERIRVAGDGGDGGVAGREDGDLSPSEATVLGGSVFVDCGVETTSRGGCMTFATVTEGGRRGGGGGGDGCGRGTETVFVTTGPSGGGRRRSILDATATAGTVVVTGGGTCIRGADIVTVGKRDGES